MKKKVLLLSDDLRVPSGIGTMSQAFIKGTLDKFDWIQIGGAIKHPDAGKVFDMSEAMAKETGVKDAYLKVFPVDGYGDPGMLREVIKLEKPDAILHFTDPRFWGWLYAMEHELRQEIPLMYYNIWDDLPFPHWNENAYESCDLLMAISKQTYNINKHVCQRKPRVEGLDLRYVPHGIDHNIFKPLDYADYADMKTKIFGDREVDFLGLFNSRNITRKHPADLISAFSGFVKDYVPSDKKAALLLHTDPVDQHGTDLPAVAKKIAPNVEVIFSNQKLSSQDLNKLYNMADVMCNPSSAEGFGLTHMEAMMAGTPTIASAIGGLQDQMGFLVDGEPFGVEHLSEEVPSNSTGLISKEYGKWTYPLWPQVTLQGSPMTPYIYDSRVSITSIKEGLRWWFEMTPEQRKTCGLAGREWAIENGFTSEDMASEMAKSINICLDNFKPRKRFTLVNTSMKQPEYPSGVLA
jgi:glycosyltransferase involved in cell wall biosynthesis